MRKDYPNSEKLKTTYEIRGLNLDRLLNTLVRSGVECYSVKKKDNKYLKLTIKNSKRKKFFAITNNLCYNDITKVRESGILYPLVYLKRNIGALLGCLFFLTATFIADDFIFSFEYSGNGSVYAKTVDDFLLSQGIRKGSRFSQIDLKELSNRILENNDEFSFVSVNKRGNALQLNLVVKTIPPTPIDEKVERLLSTVSGIVTEIKVYRGTAVVNVGDEVLEGDVLVDGFALIREERVTVNVLATVKVERTEEFLFVGDNEGQEEVAKALAISSKDFPIDKVEVIYQKQNGKHLYKVKMQYDCVMRAG